MDWLDAVRKDLEEAGELEPRPAEYELSEIVRVLAIPRGEEKDADGRGIGDDWLLADLGVDHEDNHIYVTTDRVRASELAGLRILEPRDLAVFLVGKVNESWKRYLDRRKTSSD